MRKITFEIKSEPIKNKKDKRPQNIVFSYKKLKIFVLKIMDWDNMFRGFAKHIIEDWVKNEIAKMDGFIFGLSWLNDSLIIPNDKIRDDLIRIVCSVLRKKFSDGFLLNYDKEYHNYYFDVCVDYDDEFCNLISSKVSEEKENKPFFDFIGELNYKINFLIKVVPDKRNKDEIIIRYNELNSLFSNDCSNSLVRINKPDPYSVRLIAATPFCEWLDTKVGESHPFYLDISPIKIIDSIDEIVGNVIRSGDSNKKHLYFFTLKIRINQEEIKIVDYSVKDVQDDDMFTTSFIESTGISKEKLLENELFGFTLKTLMC